MTNPLAVLQKGLQALKKQIQPRKTRLENARKAKQALTEDDEEWLDGEGNLIDEERVVELLEKASGYERRLERLDTKDRGIVEKLQNLGIGIKGTKRKHTVDNPFFDSPFSRKLEAVLASFNRQTRLDEVQTMKPTFMTNYFANSFG